MKDYNCIRWERLIELGIEFTYIKKIVKEQFGYEVREVNLEKFISLINNYKDIIEENLLNILEQETYKKASVFSIEKYKKNTEMPIIEDVFNPILNLIFKEKNDINIENGEFYSGELDECFKITHYLKGDRFIEIKLSRIILPIIEEETEDDIGISYEKEIYDCCKFIIDSNKKIVIMFYNDVKDINNSTSKEITIKKKSFRSLFKGVTIRNIIKYSLNRYLEQYFKEYMEEKRADNIRKSISIIEATSINILSEEKSLIRSVKKDFIHSEKRLDAIESDIDNEGLTVSEIECSINGILINLKMDGEISCINNFLFKEVINNVCDEFFNGYRIS